MNLGSPLVERAFLRSTKDRGKMKLQYRPGLHYLVAVIGTHYKHQLLRKRAPPAKGLDVFIHH